MATNEILQFAETDTGTNLLTQAEYLADSQRPIGNQPGVARSKLVNKALRQASLISAGVAEFLADNQANDITDGLTPQNIADYMAAVVRSLGIPTAVAGGTADAITADFTPNVSLTNGTTVIVRAGSANATTTPTFAPDGLTAKTIVKGNNLALAAGDIAGAGHWLEMNFDVVLDKWVLRNPYSAGLQIASTAESQALTDNTKAISPLRLKEAMQGSNISLAANGYQRLPSGLIIQWGSATFPNTGAGSTQINVNFPLAYPSVLLYIGGNCNGFFNTTQGDGPGIEFRALSLTSFTAYADPAGGLTINKAVPFRWMAIGY